MSPTTSLVEQQEEEKANTARAALEARCNWIVAGIGILLRSAGVLGAA